VRRFVLVALLACGGTPASPDAADPVDNPDIPPRGFDPLTTWIAAGYYKSWTCEPAPHPQEFPSNHGYNRTCNNSILHADATGTGNLPIDSASVKELIDDNDGVTIIGMAVSRKIDMTGADGWYWYQKGGMPVKMEDGRGDPVDDCIGCHQDAARDFTFAIVK
jgi:hypothetical protein